MELPAAALPCKLFIGGLSAQTTTETLRGHFSKYGRIIDAVVMAKQGKPRGFGFVTYEAPAAAAAALAEPQWLGDRCVDVKRAVPGEQPAVEHASNKVFIGGLPQEATTEDLRVCFACYGPLADAVVMVDRRTKRSRGFGFIRFFNGVQGAQATEAVLRDAAAHRLGGKWIEVKRAAPATQLQEDASPSSCSTASPSSSPKHWHQQRQQQHQLCGVLPPGMVTPSPQARRGPMCDPYGMYSHWSALTTVSDGFGGSAFSDWDLASSQMSPYSPLRHYAPELQGFDPTMMSAWPVTPGAVGGAVQRAITFGADRSPSSSTVASLSDAGEGEENRAPAANRAATPPPVAKIAPPPGLGGLGPLASPMKIEVPSGRGFEDRLVGSASKFAIDRPLLSTC